MNLRNANGVFGDTFWIGLLELLAGWVEERSEDQTSFFNRSAGNWVGREWTMKVLKGALDLIFRQLEVLRRQRVWRRCNVGKERGCQQGNICNTSQVYFSKTLCGRNWVIEHPSRGAMRELFGPTAPGFASWDERHISIRCRSNTPGQRMEYFRQMRLIFSRNFE